MFSQSDISEIFNDAFIETSFGNCFAELFIKYLKRKHLCRHSVENNMNITKGEQVLNFYFYLSSSNCWSVVFLQIA